jgi:hypothetical protein
MTIRLLADVPAEALVGKFICIPSGQVDLVHGWPARIQRAGRLGARVAYARLPRGAWDDELKEWEVGVERDAATGELRCDEREEQCLAISVRFVCDTAEEAVALYVSAVAAQKAIADFRKANLSSLDARAVAGVLPAPTYLTPIRA